MPVGDEEFETRTETNEIAVMVDSRRPLNVDPALEGVELKDYWKSRQAK